MFRGAGQVVRCLVGATGSERRRASLVRPFGENVEDKDHVADVDRAVVDRIHLLDAVEPLRPAE